MRRQWLVVIAGLVVAAAVVFVGQRLYVQRCVRNEIARMKHGTGQECANAVHALGRLGRPAVQPLRELLHNPDRRGSAVEALGPSVPLPPMLSPR